MNIQKNILPFALAGFLGILLFTSPDAMAQGENAGPNGLQPHNEAVRHRQQQLSSGSFSGAPQRVERLPESPAASGGDSMQPRWNGPRPGQEQHQGEKSMEDRRPPREITPRHPEMTDRIRTSTPMQLTFEPRKDGRPEHKEEFRPGPSQGNDKHDDQRFRPKHKDRPHWDNDRYKGFRPDHADRPRWGYDRPGYYSPVDRKDGHGRDHRWKDDDRRRDFRRHEDRYKNHPAYRYDHAPRHKYFPVKHVVHYLPQRHTVILHGRDKYHYHSGRYYRPHNSGFVLVRPPLGLITLSLPIGSRTVISAGITYHVFGDVYYRQVPSGYQVVEPIRVAGPKWPERVTVITDLLNVRYAPDNNEQIIAQVERYTVLNVIGSAPGWLYVEIPDEDIRGWIREEYVTASVGRG